MYTKKNTYIQGHTAQSHTYLHIHRPAMTHTNQYTYRENTRARIHTSRGCKYPLPAVAQNSPPLVWECHIRHNRICCLRVPSAARSQGTEHALERGLGQVSRDREAGTPHPHRELRAEGLGGRPPHCPRSTWEGPRSHRAVTPPKSLAHGLY